MKAIFKDDKSGNMCILKNKTINTTSRRAQGKCLKNNVSINMCLGMWFVLFCFDLPKGNNEKGYIELMNIIRGL